jgi:hypothetical protein
MRRIFEVTGFTFGFIFIVSVMPVFGQIHSYTDTMTVVGDTVRPGNDIDVMVKLANTFNVGGFSFRFTYDEQRLHLDTVMLMPRASELGVFGADTTHPGVVRFFAVAVNPLIEHMAPGSGPVATVRFNARWNALSGSTALTFADSMPADNSISDDTGLHIFIPILVNGTITILDGSDIPDDNLPISYNNSLYNFPNPFNSSTKIAFSINTPGDGAIEIYDILGRAVRRLPFKASSNSGNDVIWNGLDDSGREVCSGVYCYTLYKDEIPMISRKMIFLR